MAPLGGAVALEQVHDAAVRVGEHLHLDVARALDQALDQQRAVAERGARLAPRGGERLRQLRGRAHDPHALAAAAGGGLDHQREADGAGRLRRELLVGRVLERGHDRDVGGQRDPARLVLAAEPLDHVGRRADERQAGVRAGAGERGVLGQEAVAGVDGLRAGAAGGVDQRGDREVGLGRGGGADPQRDVGGADVRRLAVGVRVDGDRAQAERAGGADHAQRDLPAVGDEDGVERHHMRKTP